MKQPLQNLGPLDRAKKRLLSNKGHTFIELIFAIVLLGVAMPPLLNMFASTTESAANVDALPVATALGKELMEEIKARKFDELAGKGSTGNWSTTLVSDTGETATNKSTFDDVDDFNGWTQSFGTTYPNYSASVSVDYVTGTDLNSPLSIPSPVPNNWTPSYKRVVVTVSNSQQLAGDIQLTSVVSEIQSF